MLRPQVFIGNSIGKNVGSEKVNNAASTEVLTTEQNTSTIAPEIDKTQWNLIWVNKWNAMPENYVPTVTRLKTEMYIADIFRFLY